MAIPAFVINDLNEQTMRRYLADPEFRQHLLSDPAGTNQRDQLGLSQATVEWIEQRVTHHGVDTLLGSHLPEVPTA